MSAIVINPKVITEWKRDLATIKTIETVRIVSGEAFCDLFVYLQDDIRNAKKNGAIFKMISGPIISVCDDGQNPILDLCDEGCIELWISPYRQLSHYRVFGTRFAYVEDYHDALEKERQGECIDDSIGISKCIYKFEETIRDDGLRLQKYPDSKDMVKAFLSQIVDLKNRYGVNYDFVPPDLIRTFIASQQ